MTASGPVDSGADDSLWERCAAAWRRDGFAPPCLLDALAADSPRDGAFAANRARLGRAFNGSDLSRAAILRAAEAGEAEARALLQETLDAPAPRLCEPIAADRHDRLSAALRADPAAFMADPGHTHYPCAVPGRIHGFRMDAVREMLDRARDDLSAFRRARAGDTAVLVGNGPSLNRTDLSLLEGQDVFLSNYAIRHPVLRRLARGVAVTNYLVAEQAPFEFYRRRDIWRFFPFWLGYALPACDNTVFLNAQGGPLFFSEDVLESVAWHSTVSFFWLQVLYSAGYRKVLLVGFDHSYTQRAGAREGDLIRQEGDDRNHFDPDYFRGKTWQAADSARMEATYVLSKARFERDGREIVNCTEGGRLEVFRRARLDRELPAPRRPRIRPAGTAPRIAVVTPFDDRDAARAERQWRVIRRVGPTAADHIHLYTGARDRLPPLTLPRILRADAAPEAPDEPAHARAARLLAGSDHTHMLWLGPEWLPGRADWLAPFADALRRAPDAAVVTFDDAGNDPSVPSGRAAVTLYDLAHLPPAKPGTAATQAARAPLPPDAPIRADPDGATAARILRAGPVTVTTIVLGDRGAGRRLDAATGSALDQALPARVRHQVIVVRTGDGGAADTAADDDRVETVRLAPGIQSIPFDRQRMLRAALSRAAGDIVLLLDADDLFRPGKVARLCAAFDDPSVVVAQHALEPIDAEGATAGPALAVFPDDALTPATCLRLGRCDLFQPLSGLAFRRCYLSAQLHRLCADGYPGAGLADRLTRFAPWYGRVVGDRAALSCLRIAADVADRRPGGERAAAAWFAERARASGLDPLPPGPAAAPAAPDGPEGPERPDDDRWRLRARLDRLTDRSGGAMSPAQARTALLDAAGGLLLAPEIVIARLAAGDGVAMALGAARDALPPGDAARAHFDRVWRHAEGRCGRPMPRLPGAGRPGP